MIAIIPLRSGSKSIKNKNIKLLNGYPLAFYIIKTCIKSKLFKKIVVCSDSKEYEKVLRSYEEIKNFYFIKRPLSISKDNSPTEETINYVLSKIKSEDTIFLLQATSPLTRVKDIKNSYEIFIKHNYDSLFSAYEYKKFYWTKNDKNKLISHSYNFFNRPMRQNYDGGFVENGAIYIFNKKKYLKYNNRLFGNVGVYVMPKFLSIDIDTITDFNAVSKVLKK